MLPLIDTNVTFPAGGLISPATVLAVVETSGSGSTPGTAMVTDISPFHPINPGWPDQGPDEGTAVIEGCAVEVIDVVLGATQGDNLLIATNIPVKPGEAGWAFVVVHLLARGGVVPCVGQEIELRVDPVHREALSYGHTACHLAGLALNAALADCWRKPIEVDGLGHPNFDRQALSTSRIHPDGATDVYRLGKSLRKKGFDAEVDWNVVTHRANETLARWVASGADIRIDADGPGLTDRRTWVGTLPDGEERIACGGTHPTSLVGFAAIEIALARADAELTMETTVSRR